MKLWRARVLGSLVPDGVVTPKLERLRVHASHFTGETPRLLAHNRNHR